MKAKRTMQALRGCRALAIMALLGSGGCMGDSPPPSAAHAVPDGQETVNKASAKAAVAPPAEPIEAPQPPPPPAESSAAGREDHGRYGPKTFALPSGCGPAGTKFSCNPLTNAGCRAADDEVCDDDDNDAFACFPESDNVKEGGQCNDSVGPACGAGMTCDSPSASEPRGLCRKFCCTHADCPSSKKCVAIDREFGALGLCK